MDSQRRQMVEHFERETSVPAPAGARRHLYRLFGLTFDSAHPIPGLAETGIAHDRETPVTIDFARIPPRLEQVEVEDDMYQANGRAYLLDVPNVLRLLIEDGERIIAQPDAGCDEILLWNSIVGAGASVAGFQRGSIPLHASAILTDRGAVAFGGRSGFGKSTLVAGLVGRGYGLMADDLVLVRQEGKDFRVGEGVPEVRLLEDAARTLGWAPKKAFGVQSNAPKLVFRRSEEKAADARLRRFYAIEFAGPGLEAGIKRVAGVEAMQLLIERFRVRMRLHELPTALRHRTFEKMIAIASGVEIFHFVRPKAYDEYEHWLNRLIDHIDSEAP